MGRKRSERIARLLRVKRASPLFRRNSGQTKSSIWVASLSLPLSLPIYARLRVYVREDRRGV